MEDPQYNHYWNLFRQKKAVEAIELAKKNQIHPYYEPDCSIFESLRCRQTGDLPGAEYNALKACELSKKSKYRQGIGYSFIMLAEVYLQRGNFNEATKLVKDALQIFNEHKFPIKVGSLDAINFLGKIEFTRGNYKEAEEFFRDALYTSKELGFVNDIVRALNNTAIMLDTTGRYTEAINTYNEAIEIALKTLEGAKEGQSVLGSLFNNLGELEKLQGHYIDAEEHYKKALIYRVRHETEALVYLNLGTLYSEQGNFTDAEKMLMKSIELNKKIEAEISLPAVYGEMAQLYRRKGDVSKAKEMFEFSLSHFEKLKIEDEPHQIVLCDYVDLLGSLNKEEEAYKCLKKAAELTSKHDIPIERLRIRSQIAKLSSNRGEFSHAIYLLEDVIREAEAINAYMLAVEAYLSVAESFLFKYKLIGDAISLDKAKTALNRIETLTYEKGLLPSYIKSQFLKAILLYSPSNKDLTLLKNSIILAKKHGIVNLENFGQKLEAELTVQNLSEYEVLNVLTRNIKTISYRMIITPEVRKRVDETAMAFIVQTDLGPKTLSTENLDNIDDEFLVKLATFFTISIGQGGAYHRGLYGPLPVPDREDVALLYSFSIFDKTVADPRAQGRNYVIIALLMPVEVSNFFYDRSLIQKTIEENLIMVDIPHITPQLLGSIREKLLSQCIPEWSTPT